MIMEIFERNFRALGTNIELKLVLSDEGEKHKAENDFKKLVQEYARLEKIFSRFDPESELSYLNSHLDEFRNVSREMMDVAERSLKYHKKSEGLFDPRIIDKLEQSGYGVDFHGAEFPRPCKLDDMESIEGDLSEDIMIEGSKLKIRNRIDLSGIAKGYITDQAVIWLREKGWNDFLLDSGGDMFLSGSDENENRWRIEIEGFPDGQMILELSERAIATSGISRRQWTLEGKRFHHLINPKAPEEYSFEIKSVSAIAPTVEEADFWAKYLFLLGRENGMEVCRSQNVPGLFLTYQGQLFISDEVKKYLPKEKNESVI